MPPSLTLYGGEGWNSLRPRGKVSSMTPHLLVIKPFQRFGGSSVRRSSWSPRDSRGRGRGHRRRLIRLPYPDNLDFDDEGRGGASGSPCCKMEEDKETRSRHHQTLMLVVDGSGDCCARLPKCYIPAFLFCPLEIFPLTAHPAASPSLLHQGQGHLLGEEKR